MRTKTDYRTASRQAYKDFCKKHREIKISYTQWADIVYSFNEEFRDHILETGNKEKLPMGLGSFSIKKKKRKTKKTNSKGQEFVNLPVDWKKTKEKGKIIYNFNFHTEGYFFGWLWFKKDARVKFSHLWRFKPSRVSSRMVAHYIKQNGDYQHIYKEWKT